MNFASPSPFSFADRIGEIKQRSTSVSQSISPSNRRIKTTREQQLLGNGFMVLGEQLRCSFPTSEFLGDPRGRREACRGHNIFTRPYTDFIPSLNPRISADLGLLRVSPPPPPPPPLPPPVILDTQSKGKSDGEVSGVTATPPKPVSMITLLTRFFYGRGRAPRLGKYTENIF